MCKQTVFRNLTVSRRTVRYSLQSQNYILFSLIRTSVCLYYIIFKLTNINLQYDPLGFSPYFCN